MLGEIPWPFFFFFVGLKAQESANPHPCFVLEGSQLRHFYPSMSTAFTAPAKDQIANFNVVKEI